MMAALELAPASNCESVGPMPSLKRLLCCCSLILAAEVVLYSGSIACGQTLDVKPKPTVRLEPLASIEGRVVFESDPKAACGKRKDTAAQETMIYARQYEPEKKTNVAARTAPLQEVPL